MRYFAKISYDGTDFSGWQKQINSDTVQGTIEEALSTLLNVGVEVVGCGRTDAGVHASEYYLHFDCADRIENTEKLVFKLNGYLPKSIAFDQIFEAEGRHARFDATRREYAYYIHIRKSPFLGRYSTYYFPGEVFSVKSLHRAANTLLDYTDFASFCKSRTDVKTTICRLSCSYWEIDEYKWTFRIAADRFLRGMVRLIVGASLRVAENKITLDDLVKSIEAGVKPPMAWSVPANGLILEKIDYPFTAASARLSTKSGKPDIN